MPTQSELLIAAGAVIVLGFFYIVYLLYTRMLATQRAEMAELYLKALRTQIHEIGVKALGRRRYRNTKLPAKAPACGESPEPDPAAGRHRLRIYGTSVGLDPDEAARRFVEQAVRGCDCGQGEACDRCTIAPRAE